MHRLLWAVVLLLLIGCRANEPVRSTPNVDPGAAARQASAPSKERFSESGQSKSRGEMVIQLGHTQPVRFVRYASNGAFVVTASTDGVVKLWTPDGRLIRTIQQNFIPFVAISPDDRELLIGSGTGHLELWSVLGKRERVFPKIKGLVGEVAFSPDGQAVAACNRANKENYCQIFSRDGQPLARLDHPPKQGIHGIVFAPGGKFVYTAAFQHVHCWTREGKHLGSFKAGDYPVQSLDISPDGRRLLTASLYYTQRTERNEKAKGNVLTRLWTIDGKLVRQFPSHGTSSARFSADGQWIVSGGRYDRQVLIHDLNGRLVHRFKVGYNSTTSPAYVALAPDKRHLVTADSNLRPPGLFLWTVDGDKQRAFNEFNTAVNDMALSADGAVIVTVSSDRYIRLWSLAGRLLARFKGRNDWISNVAITPNQRVIVTAGDDLVLWSPQGKTTAQVRIRPRKGARALAFTPDGKTLITAGGDGYVNVIPLDNAHRGKRFKPHGGKSVSALAVHPDGKLFATGSIWERFRIWDLDGNLKASFEMPKGTKPPFSSVHAMAFTPDGKYLITATQRKGQELRFLDLYGKLVDSISMPMRSEGDLTIAPSGKLLAVSVNNYIGLVDLEKRRVLGYLKGHSKPISRLYFTPDETHLVSAARDGTVRVWNLQNGQSYAMMSHRDQWVIFTDDGYFDASKYGADLLAMVDGLNAYGIDQFALYLNRPDLIYQRVGIGNEELIDHYRSRYQERLQRAQLKSDFALDSLDAPSVRIPDYQRHGKQADLSIELDDHAGLAAMQIYVNDVPLFAGTGKVVSGSQRRLKESVELISGNNKIEVSALNREGVESPRALVQLEYGRRVKGDLYFVGIGVSRYRDSGLNLRYARKDVQDLQRLMGRYKGSFGSVHTLVLVDEQATRHNLDRVRKFLAQARTDDSVILAVSGHGAFELGEHASYYFVSYETDVNRLARTAIPYQELESLLSGIAPRRKLLLLDSCESGEVDPATLQQIQAIAKMKGLDARTSSALLIAHKYSKPRRWLYARDRYIYNDLSRRNGAIVFSSSEGGEISFENPKAENGFFTEAILAGLTSNKTDENHDGRISISELEKYVRLRVTKETQNLQHPIIDRDNIYQEFSLPVLP